MKQVIQKISIFSHSFVQYILIVCLAIISMCIYPNQSASLFWRILCVSVRLGAFFAGCVRWDNIGIEEQQAEKPKNWIGEKIESFRIT